MKSIIAILLIALRYSTRQWPKTGPTARTACAGLVALAFGDASAGVHVTTVVRHLEHPWALAFLPDGLLLVTERPGRLRLLAAGRTTMPAVQGVPPVVTGGQAGLFDVAVDPDFRRNRRIFLSYAEGGARGTNGTAVASARLGADGSALQDVTVIFRQLPKVNSSGHFGSRLVFARDGTLFVTLGDRQTDEQRPHAQHLDRHNGKVVRIRTDGSVPPDNPFVGRNGAMPEIWSYGHRNPQGAALHPVTGELWVSEHGPQGGDELNIARAGSNYGWPVITYGCEYGTCRKIGEGTHKAGMEQPLTWWPRPSTAPSGLAFYTGNRFPAWRGNLFSGALAGRCLWRIVLDGNRVLAREKLLVELGARIRDVRQGPDGYLYLLTDSADGLLLRLEPAP